MTPMDGDVFRWLNLVLSSMVVIFMTMGAIMRWDELPRRLKRIVPWVILTYVIIDYGSAEVLWSDDNIPAGYRVVLMMVNLSGLLIALLWRFDDADYSDKGPIAPKMFRGGRFSLKLGKREKP